MEERKGFAIEGKYADAGPSVVIEDDGRVGYAYFLSKSGAIVGDVWLYNRCKAPLSPEWTDRSKTPFANPAGFTNKERFEPPDTPGELDIRWANSPSGPRAGIYLRELLIAELAEGLKPGFALAASMDGPLAMVLRTAGDAD